MKRDIYGQLRYNDVSLSYRLYRDPSDRTSIIARYSLTSVPRTFRATLLKRRTGMPYNSGALRVLRPSLRIAVVQFAPKVRVLV